MKQKRKSLLVLSLVLVLGLSGSTFAADVYWDGSEGSDWTDGNNWIGGVVPTNSDYGMIDDSTVTQPIIVTGQTVSAQRVVVGHSTSGCTLDVTGGSITSASVNFTVGRSAGGSGTLNISGGDVIANAGLLIANNLAASGIVNMTEGTLHVGNAGTAWYTQMFTIGDAGPGTFNMDGGAVTVDEDMWLARKPGSSGDLNMTGGTIDVTGTIYADYRLPGSVHKAWGSGAAPAAIQLDGGVITASDLVMTASGIMDLTDGVMILAGDDESTIQGYIDSGLITGYGDSANVVLGYNNTNPGQTTISAIPEPATMVLLGLGGLLSLRRRRTN